MAKQNNVLLNRDNMQTVDALRYDPLRGDVLKTDGLGKDTRKNVDPYYKDIGVAMPSQKRAAYDATQDAYNQDITRRQGLLAQYQKESESALAASDTQAKGILAKARGQVHAARIRRYQGVQPADSVNEARPVGLAAEVFHPVEHLGRQQPLQFARHVFFRTGA